LLGFIYLSIVILNSKKHLPQDDALQASNLALQQALSAYVNETDAKISTLSQQLLVHCHPIYVNPHGGPKGETGNTYLRASMHNADSY